MATKSELETHLKDAKEKIRDLEERLSLYVEAEIRDWEKTDLYALSEKRIEMMSEMVKSSHEAFELVSGREAVTNAGARKVYDDNRRLAESLGHEYKLWVTETEKDRDYDRLNEKYVRLKGEMEAREKTIQFLRSVIEHLVTPESDVAAAINAASSELVNPRLGRPKKIDDQTRERIRKLRKKGLSVRVIAETEGVSNGSVMKVLKEASNP